ncbi:MAG: ATP-binding cassette domain-containing protein, partial [Noviherbaspirillum sp.]
MKNNTIEHQQVQAVANPSVRRGVRVTVQGLWKSYAGRSGCGKSTLLRLIGGQLKPRGGFVEVEGQVVRDMRDDELYRMRRKMGMMFQRSGLFTDLST